VVRIRPLNSPGSNLNEATQISLFSFLKFLTLLFINVKSECQIQLNKVFTKDERLRVIFPPNAITNAISFSSQKKQIIFSLAVSLRTKFFSDHNHVLFFHNPDWGIAKVRISMAGDVEMNPGPVTVGETTTSVVARIVTYNARGLKDKLKLKRVLNKCYNIVKENPDSFILIQETHLTEDECKNQLGLLWRESFSASPSNGRQEGTLTLFSGSWNIVEELNDEQGRFCATTVNKYGQRLCVNNIYAPNNHDIDFFTYVYDKIFDLKNRNPDIKIVL
jgi:hypothetical protein